MRANRRATIKQVAAEAGVSTQTVSRVINDRPDVSPETRERVQQIIVRLGFQPSALARSLSGWRTHTLGVVGSGMEYFGPSRTVVGIEKQAAELGYSVLLALIHEPNNEDVGPVLAELLARQVEGIIWAVPEVGNNRSWIHTLPQPAVPIVFLTMQPQADLAVVAVANRAGGRMAAEHLLAQGCRHIALIAGPHAWWEPNERRLGWEDALRAAGLRIEPRQIVEGDWGAESGAHAFAILRQRFPEMDAVVASNDQMAQGVLHAAWAAGLHVPQDLAVVGFDDIPEAAYFIPPLTTVRQDPLELGSAAVRVLNRLIDAWHQNGRIATLESIWLQPQLIVRKSSLGPRSP